MRISGSNAGYTMFRDSVKGTGYPFHSPVSPLLPLPALPCAITFQLESTIASPHFLTIFKLDPRYAVGSRSAQSKVATDHLCKLFVPNALSALQRRSFPFNPLNAELNPICHLLALLGAHQILHVSRIRVTYL